MLAIRTINLGKKYELYRRPGDILKEVFSFGRRIYHQDFWALKDITLEIPVGSTLGVVGENGAGKSTLMGILTNSLHPTEGQVHVNGRVSAILELGAGFHPEFTGRDNIYMNCSILGMTKQEIDEKFQGIADFSELGEFIGRPVKTYSSGMYVRLAFSVATSVDPEILIVDEALSVGDQHFQKKCVDRMMGFKEQGKTIIFCSHNTYQIKQVCDNAVWLKGGRLEAFGNVNEVVDGYVDYERSKDSETDLSSAGREKPRGNEYKDRTQWPGRPVIKEVILTDEKGVAKKVFNTGETLDIDVYSYLERPVDKPVVGIVIKRNDNIICYGVSTQVDGVDLKEVEPGIYNIKLRYPALPLLSGSYHLDTYLLDESGVHVYDAALKVCPFEVRHNGVEMGMVYLSHRWLSD
jgi:ABC-type polysaccharide/polyol phosphate transport system ATPase subunit